MYTSIFLGLFDERPDGTLMRLSGTACCYKEGDSIAYGYDEAEVVELTSRRVPPNAAYFIHVPAEALHG